jgi:hypothetical protein
MCFGVSAGVAGLADSTTSFRGVTDSRHPQGIATVKKMQNPAAIRATVLDPGFIRGFLSFACLMRRSTVAFL